MSGEPGAKRSRLSPAQRALLARRIRGAANQEPRPGIARRDTTAPAPATAAQSRLWFLARLYPDTAAYNMHTALRLRGALDATALERSLNAVIERHEILRTHFALGAAGELEQIIEDALEIRLVQEDLRTLDRLSVDEQARERAANDARRPFDLERGPLLRAHLYRTDDADHLLLLVVHHIVSDEWSTAIVLRELAACYHGAVSGSEPVLEALPIQFADFAIWHGERAQATRDEQLDYWKSQLAGQLPALELPADHPRPERMSLRGALVHHQLPAAVRDALQDIAKASDATLFMTLLAAFQVLLHRYTGQTDLLVGVPAANRSAAETEGLVGLFLNSLVMRARIDGDTRYSEFLAQTRDTAVAAYARQDLPLETLVAELQPDRDPGRNPLFQAMFVMESEPPTALAFDGLDCERVVLDTGTSKFDLTMFAGETADGLTISLEYCTDLLEPGTASSLLGAFDALLTGIAASPETPIGALPLVSEQDQALLTDAWTGPTLEYDAEIPWPRLFEAQVARTPSAVALRCDGESITYAELNARANRLAHHLRASGHSTGRCVGIFMERSIGQLASMLGVLKAGAAYVPLDPGYPRERVVAIVADLGRGEAQEPPLVITTSAHSAALASMPVQVLEVDREWPGSAPDTNPTPVVAPSDLAYVIYTSGSTGAPKGVTISHANLLHSTQARLAHYDDPAERYLLLSSFAFDSSAAGTFWALVTGGTLIFPPDGTERDPRQIAECVERERVTHTLMLPTLYDLVLRHTQAERLASLRTVIVAGEACPPSLARHHAALLPRTALFNEYGPTEGTVWATVYRCTGEETNTLPIGRPIPGYVTAMLNEHGLPVPRGALGELCLGGAGVSPGYLNQPGLTRERFFDTATMPGVRLYRTGDQARMRADGMLEFLGRGDAQIKLRGYRIEPGEIESRLAERDDVEEAAVVITARNGAEESTPAQPILAAYVVSTGESVADPASLRQSLRAVLPEYMVPSAFVTLDALPRTPNGKLDRARLPAPARPEPVHRAAGGPAYDDAHQERLAAIWQRMLGTGDVGPDDDFFELGGHSLLGVSLMLEIEKAFDIQLPVAALFEAPRLRDLAQRVGSAASSQAPFRFLMPIQPRGKLPPIICVHGGARLLAKHLGPDQPVYLAFHDAGNVDPEHDSVEQAATNYLAEIRRLQPHGPYYLCGFSYGGMIAYELALRLRDAGEEVGLLALCDPPPLMDTSLFGLRLRRKFAQIRSSGNLPQQAGRIAAEPFLVAGRTIRSVWRRVSLAYYERMHKARILSRWLAAITALAGLGALGVNAYLMSAPGWYPLDVPLSPRAGTSIEASFVAQHDALHEIEILVERAVPLATLRQTVLMAKEASPIDVEWNVSDTSGMIARGDARDYLYIESGSRSVGGYLRRFAFQVPMGQTPSFRRSAGLLGAVTATRGVGSFETRAGETYFIRAELGSDHPELVATNPRLIVRLGRRVWQDHYNATVPIGYAGLALVGLSLVFLILGMLRKRQSLPPQLVWFRNLQHNVRVGSRYEYRAYPGDAVLFLPEHPGGLLDRIVQSWRKVIGGQYDVQIVEGARTHLDLIDKKHGSDLARRFAEVLTRSRR